MTQIGTEVMTAYKVTLSAQVLVNCLADGGVWLARTILEQQLQEQAAIPHNWDVSSVCNLTG